MLQYILILFFTLSTFLNQQKAENIKGNLFAKERTRVIQLADEYSKEKPITVTAESSPRSAGEIHDFYSEGDYWWPDPENPDGPYIQRDGLTNPENFTAHREAMIRFSQISGALASAYLVTKDDKYVTALAPHLKAWFIDEDTKMNPNLLYAQAIKGKVTGRGIGIIDTIQLMEVAKAIEAVEDSGVISRSDIQLMKNWFAEYLTWMTTHPYGIDERDHGNNHSVCWAMQAAVFAKLVGNQEVLDYCKEMYKTVLLPDQMAEDGSFPLELKRTKPYGYSLFTLDAMATLCQVYAEDEENLFSYQSPTGKSLAKGISFLFPYVENKNTWPYQKDVMYWDKWPVRHSFLLFGGMAYQNEKYLALWNTLEADFDTPEVIRNMPVRFPLLWLSDQEKASIGNSTLTTAASTKIIAAGLVKYSDFGATGDGKTDDIVAISATHEFANKHKLKVKADDDATYYISGKDQPVIIKTDTDFGQAKFIIDDREVENRTASVFLVSSGLKHFKPEGISSLKRNKQKIDISLPSPSLITVTNSNKMKYIRYGLNQNNGAPQTDIFLVDKDGNIDSNAPIIWDFDEITDIAVLPIDEKLLTITGGHFTTIANQEESKYNYYSRNISIQRSNVMIDSLEHRIIGEGDHGAPYNGFINISKAAFVTVKNTILTGHKTFSTIGAAGKPVTMGTYDIIVNRSLNVSFINCKQTNDIDDSTYWGIMGSNYSKNLLFDKCTLSRFDAHMGVANATIRNSKLGHMGINAIGTGTFTVENSEIRGRSLINLRSDYGSTWEGKLIIRDCTFIPNGGKSYSASLINGYNSGQHDFGYTCYMPEQIIVENLKIDDSNHPEDYQGPAIFGNFNSERIDETYQEKFPYVLTKEVTLKNVTTSSGNELRVSDNDWMFKNVKVNRK
ncbi:alginate lyase family protein [Algoriphagus yeomjeoni]|uniref:Alginate lyase n=1 Tax=Algoriphagus yeomjeoni TaxID=291403 RepID=A0A327P118_9BACT|nr:alginate lyase family protein [Algoriphagus yeomjeoni]RAI85948.1 alginate lyase [Algoriphagus yeomjeoni]